MNQITRRSILRLGTLSATGSLLGRFQPAMAGPFTGGDFIKLVPEDKKLSAEWIRSLTERGEPEWFSGEELKHIGMPVGGICCGQVYLSGDGRLWHWDIFNRDVAPKNRTQGPHYAKPMPVTSAVDLGFSMRIKAGGKETVRTLDGTGFPKVRFRGAYPIGFVEFRDEELPVKVSLEAFSPFVPLDVDASSLPLTVMRYTVRNSSKDSLEVSIAGALTNPVLMNSGKGSGADFVNRVAKRGNSLCLHCTAEKSKRKAADFGDMTLAVLGIEGNRFSSARISKEARFDAGPETARGPADDRPKGIVGRTLTLEPGAEATVSFGVAWRFPNAPSPFARVGDSGHYYAERFESSLSVMDHHAAGFQQAYARTRLWHDTWYDSTLPHWLLDRVFVNTSTLATSTCLRFANGRFWGWEGVNCCPGTCTHVWHYAQSVGRVFPELERITREHVDYNPDRAFQRDGAIFFRAEGGKPKWDQAATDGQCGTILRVYREHCMSADSAFLKRLWPRVKQSVEFLIREDSDGNGVLEGAQHNTLDAVWYGPVSWLSSLYLAALRAAAVMAREMDDEDFAQRCDRLVESGMQWISENLFDGEYFYHRRDPEHPKAIGAGIGCHIDQVMGQGWAHQLGLDRVLPADKTQTALKSLWRYNFTPDVGPYRRQYKGGRWYAMPGEAGLIMCTFPKGGEREARGGNPRHGFAGYFNECMNGFEYQAAWHMIAEGLVQEGLAVTRAVHDRYHPSRRNPYNEIECSDHYARSMASHGVFVSLCGFEHHGPKGHLGFAPKITPEDFRAPFITAEGWGTFTQRRVDGSQEATLELKSGKLRLVTLSFVTGKPGPHRAEVNLGGRKLGTVSDSDGESLTLRLQEPVVLETDQELKVEIVHP
ncbi:GH116 family glycosyl hydrolase [Haloferula sp. A504]|uniref:GH116 family glycosyl hydrolase n=1 Tax=Haloferula sp. A504 TaxID=3373601 RepID=UPI0031C2A3FB|nr:GH116 family glycosyl hydrolase [Verrucomicrobiaceae bacterium E54]